MFFSTRTKLKNVENQKRLFRFSFSAFLRWSCDWNCSKSESRAFSIEFIQFSAWNLFYVSLMQDLAAAKMQLNNFNNCSFLFKKMANFVSYYTHFLSNFTIQWHIQMKKSSKTVDVLLGTNCCHQDANSQPKVQSRKRYHSAIQATHLQPFSYLPLESPELSQKHSTLLFATE